MLRTGILEQQLDKQHAIFQKKHCRKKRPYSHRSRYQTVAFLVLTGFISGLSDSAYAFDKKHKNPFEQAPAKDTKAYTFGANTWIIRAGISGMTTDVSSRFNLNQFHVQDRLDIRNSFGPFINVTYLITPNWGVEVGATLLPHRIKAEGILKDLYGGSNGKLNLPVVTAMAQYHFSITDTLKPYVGVGVNYSYARDLKGHGQFRTIGLKDHWGWALQAGVDYAITENWGLNIDVKKIQLSSDVYAPLRKVKFGTLKGKVDNNPFIFSVGLTYRF